MPSLSPPKSYPATQVCTTWASWCYLTPFAPPHAYPYTWPLPSRSFPCTVSHFQVYEKDFEEYLLTETGAFYRRKASEWIEQVGRRG